MLTFCQVIKWFRYSSIALTSLLICSHISAFSVQPQLSEILLSRSGSATINVVNGAEDTLRVEAKIFERKQDNKGNYLEGLTKDVLVFPPIMEIPANSTRSVRLMIKPDARKSAIKSYYSLKVRQLSTGTSTIAPAIKSKGANVQAQILLAFHVPIYVYPKNPKFSLSIERAALDGDSTIVTWIKNTGNTIVRMKDIRASIRVGKQWLLAMPETPARVKAIIVGNTIKLTWKCPACTNYKVSGVKVEGNAPHWGKFEIENTW